MQQMFLFISTSVSEINNGYLYEIYDLFIKFMLIFSYFYSHKETKYVVRKYIVSIKDCFFFNFLKKFIANFFSI